MTTPPGWRPRLVALDIDGTILKWVEGAGMTHEEVAPAVPIAPVQQQAPVEAPPEAPTDTPAAEASQTGAVSDARLRNLAVLKTSTINGCKY